MKESNSGKIFKFSLDHNMGFAYCEQWDFTDITKFNGKLISVFNIIDKDIQIKHSIDQLAQAPFLYGPHPLLKFPNTKGKGAWKFIGKVEQTRTPDIIFKNVRDNHTKKDWHKLRGWHSVLNFDEVGNDCDYESVRHLELPVLYGMREVEIRTTMQILLTNKKKAKDFYDLSDFHLRNIYIQTVNTSFESSQAIKLLEEID